MIEGARFREKTEQSDIIKVPLDDNMIKNI